MLKKLIEQRAALLARCTEIEQKASAENRVMTEEERTEYRSKLDEAKALKPQIAELQEAEQERADNAAALAAVPAELNRGQQQQQRQPPAANGVTAHDNAEDAPFRSFGEQLIAVRNAAEGQVDPRLRRFDLGLTKVRAAAGMSEAVASDGGFLVMTDESTDLIRAAFQQSQLWNKATNYNISSNANGIKFKSVDETSRANGSRWGGVQVYLQSEADATTASKPKFGELELSLKKLMGLAYMTDELMADAGAAESFVRQAFAEEFAFKLDDLAMRGTGAGAPLGMLNAACTVSVAKEVSQAAATVLYANVSKMRARMLPGSYLRANWFVNIDCMPQIEQMVIPVKNNAGSENVGGSAVFLNGNASNTPFGTLLGRPIIPIEHCETVGTVGDIVLADMSRYITIGKGGMQSASSIHVKFLTDELAFRFIMRIDGQPALKSAITPFKGTGTLSPFVTLATRA